MTQNDNHQSFTEAIQSATVNEEYRQALQQAQQEMPSGPVPAAPGAGDALRQWEVVVAYNLDYPYRYTQKFFWLEVLAIDEKDAINTAAEWVAGAHQYFEATDLVRPSSPHELSLSMTPTDEALMIAWNLAVDQDLQPRTMIRDPMSGLRVGFIADPHQEERWMPIEGIGRYRLLVRKPSRDASPVCLAPLVRNMGPLR